MNEHRYPRPHTSWVAKVFLVLGYICLFGCIIFLVKGAVACLVLHDINSSIENALVGIVALLAALITFSVVHQHEQYVVQQLNDRATQMEKERLIREQNEP